jgi:hypothetical protein
MVISEFFSPQNMPTLAHFSPKKKSPLHHLQIATPPFVVVRM